MELNLEMVNFCKTYYQNDNRKPSLYILLEYFKSKIPQENFIQTYVYFMKDYIRKNPNECIKLDLLLDVDIVQEIIDKNLLETNKISLTISSLNLLFNQNLNFKKNTNIEKIFLKIIDKNNDSPPKYNCIFINLKEPFNAINYLLFMKYFDRLIPETVSEIAFSNILSFDDSEEKANILLKEILGNADIYDDNNNSKIDCYKLYKLIFEELSKYKNIKYFHFNGFVDAKIFTENNKFLKNLNEISIQSDIFLYDKIANIEHLKNKLKINFVHKLEDSTEINSKINGELISDFDLQIYTANYNIKLLENILPYNIKSLELFYFKKNGDVFKIFETYTNIEKLFISYKINEEIDYSFLKYLPKLKELIINGITIENKNNLNLLFKTLNEHNQNLEILKIKDLHYKNPTCVNDISLNVNIELKNLEKLYIYDMLHIYNSYANVFKINRINIDKCEKLKKIVIPYYFECNNRKVLDHIENIRIYLLESTNINFLNTILSCKNLKKLHIIFLIPFQNYQILNALFQNIGKIRKIKCEIAAHTLIENEKDQDEFNIKKENAEKLENEEGKKYINEVAKIIEDKKFGWNFFEKFYVLPTDRDYDEFAKNKHEEKIKILKNFPIIRNYGNISLEQDYKYSKINFSREKELYLKYMNFSKGELEFFNEI